MDMGGGGRLIRPMILVLVVILVWKLWNYSALPHLPEPPDFKTSGQDTGDLSALDTSYVTPLKPSQSPPLLPEEEEKEKPKVAPKKPKVVKRPPTKPREEEEAEVEVAPVLRVEVYYEALCPDSRHFIMKQLTPAYRKLSDIIDVALVPYGKATTHVKNGKVTFECQHGPVECKANMVHACVTKIVKNTAKQLAIVHCMIDEDSKPMFIGQKCVESHGEEWEPVSTCVDSDEGRGIMKHMGIMTHNLHPSVHFIPTITIDGSQKDQKYILQDLHKVLCKRYEGPKPPSC